MMQILQLAEVLGAKLLQGTEDASFLEVSTDTRTLKRGDLYIALRGLHFDGANFVAQAAQEGAAASIVNEQGHESIVKSIDARHPILLVKDTRLALGRLASYWRHQFDIPLVAVTGSNGKTTVKEMIASILRAAAGDEDAVLATRGNLNNDVGMPMTLLQLTDHHRYAVIEMGMNHPGEIDYLTRIAAPKVALITNASGAHLEGLGSVEAVAKAKGEIFSGLQFDGSAIINADDAHAPLWRSLAGAHSILEFGLGSHADVTGSWQAHESGQVLFASTPSGDFTVKLQVPGAHNAANALAATAVAVALNLSLQNIVAGLERFAGVAGRMQRKKARRGAAVIDDTYNANPASLHAAIKVLESSRGRRVLVLGDMGELGDSAAALHAEIGRAAKESGIDKLYAIGKLSGLAVREFGSNAQHFERMENLQDALEEELQEGTTLLIKGSRFMKMERVVERLVESGIDMNKENTCC